ncbi:MAG TPA: ATP-binding protein [Candidatus Methylacidiphilales bacterium]|nr:ATP-binding protein [Candidatus Methylacidiphilales bacterium]
MTARFLTGAGHAAEVCRDMTEICQVPETNRDIILLAEETLNDSSIKVLNEMLARQPEWSDIPITVITSGGESSPERLRILTSIGPRANVSVLERPFRRGTLLSAVEVALKARQRQYEVRDLLAERKEAQASLENVVNERTAELTETNEQLETLVYSIAHDLRAPLRSMQAFARILLDDYAPQLDSTAQGYAERIARSAETMDTLVLDLLAYGKMARSGFELENVELEASWKAAQELFENEIRDRGAVITVVRPLPAVRANLPTLTQVFANLLGNALKFVPESVTPVITLKADVRDGNVHVSLQDNGIGIAPEYHEKIFRVFERLEKNESEGNGIGLAIVRKGIERMGGKVGVESNPPAPGCTFWIELKRAS